MLGVRLRELAARNAVFPTDVEQPREGHSMHGGDAPGLGGHDDTLSDAVEANAQFIYKIMERYDVDHDGYLSKAECMSLMCDLNGGSRPTEAEVLMVFASCDVNHDGLIDIHELTKVLIVYMAHSTKDQEGGRYWFWWRLGQWLKALLFT